MIDVRPSVIESLTCGYSSVVRQKKVLVVMQAYVDESQGSRAGNLLLLAACIHTAPMWAEFSDKWRQVLDAQPAIKSFHMREARNLSGEFAGWKRITRDMKVIALTDVIMSYRPHIVLCWLSRDEYNEIMHGVVPYDLRHAYFKGFCGIVLKVAEYLAMVGSTTPADYIFDDNGDVGNEALMWYAALKESAPDRIKKFMGSTPVFRNDEEILPLQAADLVAWHKRRRKEVYGLDPEVAATLRIDELPGGELHMTREYLQLSASKMAALPNVSLFLDRPSAYQSRKSRVKKEQRRNKAKKPNRDGV